MTAGHLVVVADLDFDARREFISTTTVVINRTEGNVTLDCSQLGAVDGATLGMLVALSRAAARHGSRLILEMSSPRVRNEIDAAGVSDRFDWSL